METFPISFYLKLYVKEWVIIPKIVANHSQSFYWLYILSSNLRYWSTKIREKVPRNSISRKYKLNITGFYLNINIISSLSLNVMLPSIL